MISYRITMPNANELLTMTDIAPRVVRKHINAGMRKATTQVRRAAWAYVPKLTRQLYRSIDRDVVVGPLMTKGIVSVDEDRAAYGRPVETGGRAHIPPIAPLKVWAQRRFGDATKAYAIRQSIKRHGTSLWMLDKTGDKGAYFMDKAATASEPYIGALFNEVCTSIVRELTEVG